MGHVGQIVVDSGMGASEFHWRPWSNGDRVDDLLRSLARVRSQREQFERSNDQMKRGWQRTNELVMEDVLERSGLVGTHEDKVDTIQRLHERVRILESRLEKVERREAALRGDLDFAMDLAGNMLPSGIGGCLKIILDQRRRARERDEGRD